MLTDLYDFFIMLSKLGLLDQHDPCCFSLCGWGGYQFSRKFHASQALTVYVYEMRITGTQKSPSDR